MSRHRRGHLPRHSLTVIELVSTCYKVDYHYCSYRCSNRYLRYHEDRPCPMTKMTSRLQVQWKWHMFNSSTWSAYSTSYWLSRVHATRTEYTRRCIVALPFIRKITPESPPSQTRVSPVDMSPSKSTLTSYCPVVSDRLETKVTGDISFKSYNDIMNLKEPAGQSAVE